MSDCFITNGENVPLTPHDQQRLSSPIDAAVFSRRAIETIRKAIVCNGLSWPKWLPWFVAFFLMPLISVLGLHSREKNGIDTMFYGLAIVWGRLGIVGIPLGCCAVHFIREAARRTITENLKALARIASKIGFDGDVPSADIFDRNLPFRDKRAVWNSFSKAVADFILEHQIKKDVISPPQRYAVALSLIGIPIGFGFWVSGRPQIFLFCLFWIVTWFLTGQVALYFGRDEVGPHFPTLFFGSIIASIVCMGMSLAIALIFAIASNYRFLQLFIRF